MRHSCKDGTVDGNGHKECFLCGEIECSLGGCENCQVPTRVQVEGQEGLGPDCRGGKMSEVKVGAGLRSILTQVAFKGAIEMLTARGTAYDVATVRAATEALYNELIALHEQYDAGDDPNDPRNKPRGGGGGGYRGASGGQQSQAKVPSDAKTVVKVDYFGNGNLVDFYDNRPFKQGAASPHPQYGGQYSARSADFQSVQKIDAGDGKDARNIPIWLTSPEGEPNREAQAMIDKALGASANTAPFS